MKMPQLDKPFIRGTYKTQLLVSCTNHPINALHLYTNFIEHLSPDLLRLSLLHNFTIESQVQFHAPLAFKPTLISVDDVDAYGLTPEDLTVFVNSAQWTLCEHPGASHMSC
jgi:hypothetical protein